MYVKSSSLSVMVFNLFFYLILTFSTTCCDEQDLTGGAGSEKVEESSGGDRQPELRGVSRASMDKFIGANAFVDDPVDKMQAVGFIREYHKWHWDENLGSSGSYEGYPNNHIRWAPSAIKPWDFDKYYSSVKNAGLEIAPCLQGAPKWLQGRTDFPAHDKPLDEPDAPSTSAHSYEAKAHYMYQFAARYGSTSVSDDFLTLAPDQPRNTGMGLVKYIEDWNEQDATWQGANARFSPQEYAAMASANYDGHARTMKQGSGTFGVKNADPNIKLVMAGLAYMNLDYVKQMRNWFLYNRPDKKFALDVINVHVYAWLKPEMTWRGGGPSLSPEAADFKGQMKEWIDYRNRYLPNVEVWVSEFGWDTNPASPLCPPAIGPFDIQEVQGQWIVRAYLAFAAAGVDRAQMFMLRDVDPASATHYSTSGLVGPKGNWYPKTSWYYVSTMKNTLANMVFVGEANSGNPNVLIYKFKNLTTGNGAYAIWTKTSSNYCVNDYQLSLSGSPASAKLVEMKPGDADGVQSSLTISGNKVTVDVSERPAFILVNKM